jgi:hypothetical protein
MINNLFLPEAIPNFVRKDLRKYENLDKYGRSKTGVQIFASITLWRNRVPVYFWVIFRKTICWNILVVILWILPILWGASDIQNEAYYLLVIDAVYYDRRLSTFRGIILPPFSELDGETSKQTANRVKQLTVFFLLRNIFSAQKTKKERSCDICVKINRRIWHGIPEDKNFHGYRRWDPQVSR